MKINSLIYTEMRSLCLETLRRQLLSLYLSPVFGLRPVNHSIYLAGQDEYTRRKEFFFSELSSKITVKSIIAKKK
jgi:hypothetical protein